MSPNIKYINQNKVRKTISNIGFKEDVIHQAHSLKAANCIPYVSVKYVMSVLKEIKEARPETSTIIDEKIKDLSENS